MSPVGKEIADLDVSWYFAQGGDWEQTGRSSGLAWLGGGKRTGVKVVAAVGQGRAWL